MSVLISDSFKIRESTSDEWESIQFSINSPGVPTGGAAGQYLVKQSGTDYDTAWETRAQPEAVTLQMDSAVAENGSLILYRYGPIRVLMISPDIKAGGLWQQLATVDARDKPLYDIATPTGGYNLQNGELYIRTDGRIEINVQGAGYAKGVAIWFVA